MKRWIAPVRITLLTLMLLTAGCAAQPPEEVPVEPATILTESKMIEPEGFVQRIHDPVMAQENGKYYVFSTGGRIIMVCSPDKITWEFCGRVFERNPKWTAEVNPNLGDIWAPDITFFNGKWHLYYAVSTFGTQESAIGLATNVTLDRASPDYAWVDEGEILRSRAGDLWNAIDPALVLDEEGEPWLAWGSFWTGIYMRKVDAATGRLSEDDTTVHHLADRSTGPDNTTAIEAPYLLRHGEYWYLFVSFDQCCQGVASTYNTRIGRSKSLTGPYLDKAGVPMTEGGGTLFIAPYGVWKGPGHNGMLVEDGVEWIVYHAYHGQIAGVSYLRMESLGWDSAGWPVLASQTP